MIPLTLQSELIRKRLVEVIYRAKAGHIGGGLSSLNTLTALYFHVMNIDPHQPMMPGRDRFVMSKGHCCEALFAVLEARGYFDAKDGGKPGSYLDTLGEYLSDFAGHPTTNIPGIEFNTGALGHGLSLGIGCALAARMDQQPYRTFVMMGDGEQGEGSIYEAAMAASHYKLDNLVAMIDRNGLQISDTTEHVMSLEPIQQRWEAFGWDVREVNGDSMDDVVAAFDQIDYHNQKPHLLVLRTTKGHNVSLMEGVLKWHHGVPTAEEYAAAMAEIDQRIENLKKIANI